MSSYEVVVLGAGAAGLAAARVLAEAGLRVALLEARDRIGGRIFTDHVTLENSAEPVSMELGAEFVHGLPQVIWDLVKEANLSTSELDGERRSFARGRFDSGEGNQGDAERVIEEMMAWLAKQPAGTDASFCTISGAGGNRCSAAQAGRLLRRGLQRRRQQHHRRRGAREAAARRERHPERSAVSRRGRIRCLGQIPVREISCGGGLPPAGASCAPCAMVAQCRQR